MLAGLALGCGAGVFSLLVHSMFDFNLQIPSNALLFLFLSAVLSRIAASVDESKAEGIVNTRSKRLRNRSLMMTKIQTFIRGAIVAVSILIMASAANFAQTRQQPQIKPPAQSSGEFNTTPTIIVSPGEDYRIGPRDVIEIRIEDAPELSVTIPVNADGTFLMGYLGRIKAQEKTPEELGKEIANGLRGRYLKNPQVLVSVKQYYSRSFYISWSGAAPRRISNRRSPVAVQTDYRGRRIKRELWLDGFRDARGQR